MLHNLTFKVMFFAGGKEEWRVYSDSGRYVTCSTPAGVGEAIESLIRTNAKDDLKKYGDGTWSVPIGGP